MGFGEKVIEILDWVGSLMLKATCAIKIKLYIFYTLVFIKKFKKSVGVRENLKEGNWNRMKKGGC